MLRNGLIGNSCQETSRISIAIHLLLVHSSCPDVPSVPLSGGGGSPSRCRCQPATLGRPIGSAPAGQAAPRPRAHQRPPPARPGGPRGKVRTMKRLLLLLTLGTALVGLPDRA